MTLDELLKQLQSIRNRSPKTGSWPVQGGTVEGGIPIAIDIALVERAQSYDGERIWLWLEQAHAPEWMDKV